MGSEAAALAGAIGALDSGAPPQFKKALVVAVDGLTPTQTVSVQLDGDTSAQIDNVAFMDSYRCPGVGDVVIAVKTGADLCVLGRFAAGDGLIGHALLAADGLISITVPQNFDHLRIYLVGGSVSNPATGFDDVQVQFNGDTNAHYSRHFGYTRNASAWATGLSNGDTFITGGFVQGNNAPGAGGGYTVIEIPFYGRSSLSKQIVFNCHASSGVGAPDNYIAATGGGIWGNSTGAVTSILLSTATSPNTFKAGSEVYVYGV